MQLSLSESVTRLLVDVGWTTDRSVEIESLLEKLKDHGFNPNPFACNFLTSLYDIEITPPRNPDGAYRPAHVRFDPYYDSEFDRIHAWESAFAPKSVTPIGKGFARRSSLVLGENGVMYGISDIGVSRIGEDTRTAMDVLLLGTERPVLVHDVRDRNL